MREESGRSMIEMLGVLALAAIAAVGAFKIYDYARLKQTRIGAEYELSQMMTRTNELYLGANSFEGISLEYLVDAGVIKSTRAPITCDNFLARAVEGRAGPSGGFALVFEGVSNSDCEYWTGRNIDWAVVVANGDGTCRDKGNEISFISN